MLTTRLSLSAMNNCTVRGRLKKQTTMSDVYLAHKCNAFTYPRPIEAQILALILANTAKYALMKTLICAKIATVTAPQA